MKITYLLIDMPMTSWQYWTDNHPDYGVGSDDNKADNIQCDESSENYVITLKTGEIRYWNYKNVAGHKVSFLTK